MIITALLHATTRRVKLQCVTYFMLRFVLVGLQRQRKIDRVRERKRKMSCLYLKLIIYR